MELAEIQDQQLMELPLFDQIDRNDIRPMLTCLGAFVREYRRKEYAVLDDELMAHVCVLMSGCIFMLKEDQEGHRSFLTYIQPGELFGESFALRHSPVTSVSFLAARPSQVLCLPLAKALHTCSNRCVFHETLVSNLYEMLSRKNLALMQKIDILSRDTLRDKLLSFLRLQLTGDSKAGASRGLSIHGAPDEQIRAGALSERQPDLPLPGAACHGTRRSPARPWGFLHPHRMCYAGADISNCFLIPGFPQFEG